ncbi:MAG: hypothetical protein GWP19_06365 [Planctomycetia bacterium]|nr:hypothetical protein [Planctomycetia bacterium]
MNKNKQSDEDRVRADVVSRVNALNGKYKTGKFGLEFWDDDYIPESPEIVKMRADLADKLIEEANSLCQDTTDLNVLKSLSEKVNSIMGKPISKSESIMTSIMVSLTLIVCYGIAIGIWGLVFSRSFFGFGLYGAIAGLLISLLFVTPVIAKQKTKERIRDVIFSVDIMWSSMGIIIGILGIVAWIIRSLFF